MTRTATLLLAIILAGCWAEPWSGNPADDADLMLMGDDDDSAETT